MAWLLPDPGAARRARLCWGHVADGPVADLMCVRCGDESRPGTAPPAGEETATVVVQDAMSSVGWRRSGPVCPGCVGELAR